MRRAEPVTIGGMRLLNRRPVAIAYWFVAAVLSVFAGVAAANAAVGFAPETTDELGEPTTNGAQILYGLVGFALGMLGAIAVFAGVWLALWALERRSHPQVEEWDESDDEDDFDDILVDEEGERFRR
ncbi:hypothetical protein FB554_2346 [Barrientosiimonas humi]|mgnify:CR=1 FL=1|uniref:Uncharacterized protein n=2 Tax=Barrientosiimonas TaxID=1535207 RepID=A0A542XEH5_9MICO|nr:hypothetical protein FB554_2346 [Barrientosiimonas humi]CAG7574178.1 hypothetical protein BH39T_PBIAJDOK_02821 [Barrientosiimonas humi]